MKKLFAFAAMAFISAMSLAAWEHSAGLEFSAPFFSINAKSDGIKNLIETHGTARYFGKAQNGFCVSGTLGMGGAFSENFTLQGEDATAKGFGMELALGAGYAFELTDRLTLAALGSLSLDWAKFKYKKQIPPVVYSGYYSGGGEWTQTDNALFVGLGVEILARFKLTDRLSLIGSFAARFLDGGTLWKSGTYMNRDYDISVDLRGNFSLTPSLGASWTF